MRDVKLERPREALKLKNRFFGRGVVAIFVSFVFFFGFFASLDTVSAASIAIPNAGFESNTFDGWSRGSQTGNLGSTINGGGTGVTIFSGSRTFSHGPHGAMGSPTKGDGSPNPYYAPAVAAGSWTFAPNNATYAVALQPKGEQTFSQAMTALGLSGSPQTAIQAQLTADRNASGFGSPNPTDAAWITRDVELTAGTTYTMSWNYLGTDYVPFNDGSVTSLVAVSVPSTPVITVNNFERTYALLGFTNPGTGDYSTNSYGATGWQTSTYEVSVTGTYRLGFAVFNLGDTSLSPVLMIDNATGTTDKCAQNGTNCVSFGGVEPNNETAPTVAPTTTSTTTTTTTTTSTSTTTTTTTMSTTTSTTTTTVPSLDNAVWGQINENETLTLSAPQGNVFTEVLFASYGLPNGTDGNYTIGSCHATSSQAYVEGIALGESTVSIVASNSNFGDPCGGVGKNLKVALLYGAPTTAPVSPYYNPVQNLTATANEDGSVTLDWDAPEASNLSPYMYSVTFYDLNNGVESGGWGVWTLASNTTYTLSTGMFSGNNPTTTGYGPVRFKVKAGSGQCVGVGSGDCVYGPTVSADATVIDPSATTTTTTTSTTTTTTTVYVPSVTTTTAYVVPVTPSTVVQTTTTTTEPEPEDTTTTQPDNTVPETTVPEETQPEEEENETTTTIAIPDDAGEEEAEENSAPDSTDTTEPTEPQPSGGDEPDNGEIPQESTDPVQESSDETTEETLEIVEDVVAALDEANNAEEIIEAVTELLDDVEKDELAAVVEQILDAIIEEKEVDELSEEDKEQIAAVVAAVIQGGVDESVAAELASNAAVIASIDTEQATEIFAAIDEGELSDEQGEAIVAAIQDASEEVKETFEDQVNVFAGAFDNYVPLGSTIDVGTRRAVIAVAALQQVAMGVTAVAATSGNIGGQSSSSANQNDAARREEEEEEEEAGELEGTDLRPWLDTISIWIYVNGIRKFSMKKFLQKFWYETLALGFTLSSSIILWVTLSGFTRNVAIVATLLAFAAHYYLVMWKQQNGGDE